MPVKISIHKVTAQGEQLSTEITLDRREFEKLEKGQSVTQIVQPYLKFADDRLMELNSRIIRANHLVKKLPVEAQMAIHNVMEVLNGQVPGPAPEEIIAQEQRDVHEARLAAEKRVAEVAAVEQGNATKLDENWE